MANFLKLGQNKRYEFRCQTKDCFGEFGTNFASVSRQCKQAFVKDKFSSKQLLRTNRLGNLSNKALKPNQKIFNTT